MQNFMPHGHCYLWQFDILLMHVVGDGLISLSYFAIPIVLWRFQLKTKHTSKKLQLVLIGFAAFIVFCGITHAFSIFTTWVPLYFTEGILKSLTALVSILTAIYCWILLPDILKIPSSSQLRTVNDELKLLNRDLEDKVNDSTKNLRIANEAMEQEILERSKLLEQLTYIQETMNDGWFVFSFLDNDFNFSGKFLALLDKPYDGKENGIKFLESVLLPKSRILLREFLAELKQSLHNQIHSQSQEIQVSLRDFGGQIRHFILRAKMSIDPQSQQVLSLLGTLVDITSEVNYKSELRKINSQLEQRNNELNQFINAASHDLKSPLRAIYNLSEWILEDEENQLSIQSRKDFAEINNRSVKMKALLDGLLEYCRLGVQEQEAEIIDLDKVTQTCLQVSEKPAEFQVSSQGLPQIISYRVPIELIFRNLLQNAINHRQSDKGHLWIEAEADQDSNRVLVSFKDDGMGIEQQDMAKIFQMFKTGSGSIENSTGLGLTLVEKAVSSCEGKITVESNGKNQGAVFKLELPINLDLIRQSIGVLEKNK